MSVGQTTNAELPILEADHLEKDQAEVIKSSGRLAGTIAGQMFFTQLGREAAEKTINEIRSKLKARFPGTPKNSQIIHEIDNNSGKLLPDDLEPNRIALKRIRSIINFVGNQRWAVSEDHQLNSGITNETFSNGVKDGWYESKQRTEFPDEKPESLPWFFTTS